MADDKIDISIRTTADTTGAKEAAAGLAGLEKQAAATGAALDGVADAAGSGGAAGGGGAAAGGGAGRPRGGRRGGKGAAAAIKEIAEEAPKAAAGSRQLGGAMSQVGFQVQDFAVQVGAGTSAVTAFAQQGSQLLGIFGPGGAIAGALLAVGATAFNVFQATSKGAEESGDSMDHLKEGLEEVRKMWEDFEASRDGSGFAAMVEALDSETEAYRRINEQVAANISLMQARRRAQAEIESAQAALELARIDADPNMSEEDKIRARAGVQEGIEQGRLRERLAGIADRVAGADGEAQSAAARAQAAEEARKSVQRDIAARMLEVEELRPKVAARENLPGTRAAFERALAEAREVDAAGGFQDGKPLTPRAKEVADREAAARAKLAEAERLAASDEEQARFDALRSSGLDERRAELERKREEEEAARKAAEEAAAKRAQVVAEAEADTAGAVNSFELGRQGRAITTDARAATAAESQRAAEAARIAAEEAERRRAADADAARRSQLGREGESIADGLVEGAANGRQQAALEQIGNRIAADPTGGGLGQLTAAIEAMMTAADEARRRELRQALERIGRLEAKVKKKGDNS